MKYHEDGDKVFRVWWKTDSGGEGLFTTSASSAAEAERRARKVTGIGDRPVRVEQVRAVAEAMR